VNFDGRRISNEKHKANMFNQYFGNKNQSIPDAVDTNPTAAVPPTSEFKFEKTSYEQIITIYSDMEFKSDCENITTQFALDRKPIFALCEIINTLLESGI
jgi:hypothetical protein